MPPSPIAVAILEFGRLLHAEERRHHSDRDVARLQRAEQQFLEIVLQARSPTLRAALDYNISKPIEPLVLRTLAYVAFINLCSTRYALSLAEVVKAVTGDDPASVLEARQTVSKLLINRHLTLKGCDSVELGKPLLDYLAGGRRLALTESDLQAEWRRAEAEAARRRANTPPSFKNFPTARQLAAKINTHVVGLDREVRTLASRLALHLRRSALIRTGRDPGSPNECLLFVGASGCGKTWLAETAGHTCGLPFGSISATDITCEGYIGLGVDDAIKQVVVAAGNDVERARFGVSFIDELDKKRASGWEHGGRDVAGASVQQGLLRLLEGCDFQVGGRKGSLDWAPTLINTRGMFFICAGAFVGLEQLLNRRNGQDIGFGRREDSERRRQFIHDALQDYGIIPELVNRLTAVLVFPEPTVEQLIEIATRSVIPSFNRVMSAFGAEVRIMNDGIRLVADCAHQTRTYARGIKSIVSTLIEELVFEERKGVTQLGVAEVRRAVEEAGLAVESS